MNGTERTWRLNRGPAKPDREIKRVTATRIFDRLSFIGSSKGACYLLETSEGFAMLDFMFTSEEERSAILEGIAELGLDPKDMKAILVTHGHQDHFGFADRFREEYGCRVYMSKTDFEFARTHDIGPMGSLDWEICDFIEGGDVFTLGDSRVYICSTPGHTPGCLSFIIPVTDEGEPHVAALWGGLSLTVRAGETVQQLESVMRFKKIAAEMKADAEISNHPFSDGGAYRAELLRHLPKNAPNPFVIGCEGVQKYLDGFIAECVGELKKRAAELDAAHPEYPEYLPRAKYMMMRRKKENCE